jgi:hypothetical protein
VNCAFFNRIPEFLNNIFLYILDEESKNYFPFHCICILMGFGDCGVFLWEFSIQPLSLNLTGYQRPALMQGRGDTWSTLSSNNMQHTSAMGNS